MTAALLVEAFDAARRLGWALLVWIGLGAVAVTVALYAVLVTVWATVKAVRRACAWLYARLPAERPAKALPEGPPPHRPAEARRGRTPSWAHTQPIEHEWDEAA